MALKIPAAVLKVLRSNRTPRDKYYTLKKMYRPKISSGCANSVLIFASYVVKVPQVEMSREHRFGTLRQEYDFIQNMRKNRKIRRFFPETKLIGGVMVQERCDVNWNHHDKFYSHVENLADKLGIYDAHEDNIGWKRNKKGPYPVFIDVNLRHSKSRRNGKKVRSWFPEKVVV